MPVDRFLDTNILLYAYDRDSPSKRIIAVELIKEALHQPARVVISVQVLQEFQVNFIRNGHSSAESSALVGDFLAWKVIDNTRPLFQLGQKLQERWQLSLWDSMILAAAQVSGAKELLTEDLNHGQDYGGVHAINPFR